MVGAALGLRSHMVERLAAEREVVLAATASAFLLAEEVVRSQGDVCHATPKSPPALPNIQDYRHPFITKAFRVAMLPLRSVKRREGPCSSHSETSPLARLVSGSGSSRNPVREQIASFEHAQACKTGSVRVARQVEPIQFTGHLRFYPPGHRPRTRPRLRPRPSMGYPPRHPQTSCLPQ